MYLMRNLRRVVALGLVVGLLIAIGIVVAETSYLFDGAEISTYHAGGGLDRGHTRSTSGVNHYRVKAHIRAWGGQPNPLKGENFHDCYNCLTTNNNVYVPDFYALTVTQHISRKLFTSTQYQGYTSDISGYSTHTCWTSGLGAGCP